MDKKETKKRSLILEYFTTDIMIELTKITMLSDYNNNEKGTLVKELLKNSNIPFNSLGSGTNRLGIQIDGYAVKIALDKDGMIDNRREMLYAKALYPYVIKVYECIPNGLIAVTEFVEIFTLDDYHMHRDEMESILKIISEQFLIGDVGITGKNYVNWGTRNDGTICILDFAYCYSVSYNTFKCSCNDDTALRYDKNYVNLICPICGRKYTFGEVRRRITRKSQEEEIGDIRRLGYVLHSKEEIVELNPDFEPKTKKDKKDKVYTETELAIKKYKKSLKKDYDYWSQYEDDDQEDDQNND